MSKFDNLEASITNMFLREAIYTQKPYSIREAAEFLNISERTLREITEPHGPLKCVHINKRVLYRFETLVNYLKDQEKIKKTK